MIRRLGVCGSLLEAGFGSLAVTLVDMVGYAAEKNASPAWLTIEITWKRSILIKNFMSGFLD